jgi:hypothetical protein
MQRRARAENPIELNAVALLLGERGRLALDLDPGDGVRNPRA